MFHIYIYIYIYIERERERVFLSRFYLFISVFNFFENSVFGHGFFFFCSRFFFVFPNIILEIKSLFKKKYERLIKILKIFIFIFVFNKF